MVTTLCLRLSVLIKFGRLQMTDSRISRKPILFVPFTYEELKPVRQTAQSAALRRRETALAIEDLQ